MDFEFIERIQKISLTVEEERAIEVQVHHCKQALEFQVFSWTNKIRRLTSHLELHRKDYSSQRSEEVV